MQPKQLNYNESYTVTYWETFTVDGGTVTFCVRHWPATLPWPARYELSVYCSFGTSSSGLGLNEAATGLRRPTLLWDIDGSVPFSWTPPAPLPATEGLQQVDFVRKCVVTQFQVAPRGWKLTLMWLAPSQGPAQPVPSRVSALVMTHDGRRIAHPATGKSFQIPLLGLGSPGPGPDVLRPGGSSQALLDVRAFATAVSGAPSQSHGQSQEEFAEAARRDLERQRLQQQQCEAILAERGREAIELERQVSELPSVEVLSEIKSLLVEETAHRQRCQNELLELRGWPRVFCELQPGVEQVGACGLTRRSRSEVSVPSLRQSFDFDFVLEPSSSGSGDELWTEARPVLDSALRSPSSYACFILAAAGSGAQGQRALAARMVDHLFESVVSKAGEGTVEAALAMIEMGPDNSGFYNLLQDAQPMERCVAPKLVEDSLEGSLAVHELSILSLRTREEVLAAQNDGATRRSKWRGHSILSICVQRHDSVSGELLQAARLVIVEMGSLPESVGPFAAVLSASEHGPATSSRSSSGCGKQLLAVARVTQACIDRTFEACNGGGRPATIAPVAPLQAKMVIIASVSTQLRNLEDSLPVLQLAAASSVLQERPPSKPDDDSRKKMSKLLQENQRLRAELAERGRTSETGPAWDHSEALAHEGEMASPLSVVKASSMASPNVRSPRERAERRTCATPASPPRCWGSARESRTPEIRGRRGGAVPVLLPSR